MTINNDRTLRAILEKVELLTGERSDGSRRAVLISELNGLIQDLSDQNAVVKKSITALESQIGASSASLTQELMTLASNNTALAQAITTLKTSIAGNLAEIQDTKRAIATSDMALAEQLQTLSSKIGGNTAQIVEEKRTRATQDTALAQSITTLTSTVNGHTSSISTLQSTTANMSGALSATWAMTMTLDSSTGGMKLTGVKKADDSGATFNLILDTNVTINGSLVVHGTITTDQYGNGPIANNAVSSSGYGTGTGSATTRVTVRPNSRVQIIAVAKASTTTQSKRWYSTNFNAAAPQHLSGSSWVSGYPDPPSTAVSSLGSITITKPDGNETADIIGAYNGSSSDTYLGVFSYIGVSPRNEFGYDRNYNVQVYATTAITNYFNNTANPVTFDFSLSASGVNTTVSIYVVELSK